MSPVAALHRRHTWINSTALENDIKGKPMKDLRRKLTYLLLTLILGAGTIVALSGCKKEDAGNKINKAADKVGDAAEEAGDKIDKAL